eukprot:129710_1
MVISYWHGENQFLLPKFSHFKYPETRKDAQYNLVKGAIVGGGISYLYSSPRSRVLKFAVGWGGFFLFFCTRGLYNTPDYMKRNVVKTADKDGIIRGLLEEYRKTGKKVSARPWYKKGNLDEDNAPPASE